jgi:serine/threonine-protein kinase
VIVLGSDENIEVETPPTRPHSNPRRRPSEPLLPGERYELGEQIGRGGMGEVIAAHDHPIGREVAIKRMHGAPTPLAYARFLREARVQGQLDHPAIVPVHELGLDDEGRPFFAMKKLSGTTLARVLKHSSPQFTRQQLLRAFADVCFAVEFAHTRGVIHRDIKPANIVLGDFGEVYVLDWGIARVAGDRPQALGTRESDDPDGDPSSDVSTRPGSTLGTPGYMAPEQGRCEDVDARADVYSLGCILFEILAGSPLHPRTRDAIFTTQHGIDARPSLRAADIPPELDELCVHATALRADDRIASARELAERLNRYLDGDRDLALRGRLARQHLAIAQTAANNDGDRRVAMQEAAQALALDPTLTAAGELIGRLMIEPPKQLPADVRSELAETDRTTSRRVVHNVVVTHAVTLALVPITILLGVTDKLYLSAFAGLATLGLFAAVLDLRLGRDLVWVHNLIVFATMVLMARGFTPFLIAPAAVAVNTVAFASHPRGTERRDFIAFMVLSLGAILGVWVCELVGLLPATMIFSGGTLSITSPIEGVDAIPMEWVLAFFVTIGTINAGILAFRTARVARQARERAHLQAWQVRQLSPLERAGK